MNPYIYTNKQILQFPYHLVKARSEYRSEPAKVYSLVHERFIRVVCRISPTNQKGT